MVAVVVAADTHAINVTDVFVAAAAVIVAAATAASVIVVETLVTFLIIYLRNGCCVKQV